MKKEIKKFLFNNSTNIIIVILSIIVLLIGSLVLDFLKVLVVVIILDLLWFIPPIIKNKSRKNNKENRKGDIMTKPKKEKKKKKIGKKILLGLLITFIVLFILGILFFVYIAVKAPKFNPDQLYHKESSILYMKNGDVFAKIGSEKREIITYDQMSENLVNAIVATEDARFFKHNGFDLPRFVVASVKQLLGKSDAGGASTLTMQVVKNHFTSTVDTGIKGIIRKFTDIYMSIFQVEKKYSKEEIMEFYANSNYLGGGAYGVEQASLTYFGKHASELNVAESALIAGLFNAPVALDPYNHPDAAEKRRKTVLYLMERHGYINEKEKKEAEKLTVDKLLVEKQSTDDTKYQGFINTVAEEVKDLTGQDIYSVPMEVYTTMDKAKQDAINDIMNGVTYTWENEDVTAGISVMDVKTGEIVAVGTGRKTGAKTMNLATMDGMQKRQIGSTAKPLYDYGPGMEYNNWSTYQPFVDEPYQYSDGTPIKNYDSQYKGFMSSRHAIMDSRNIPALKAFQQVKNSNIKKFVTSLGLSPEISSNGIIHEAHAIGGYNGESPVTMAGAYAAFANGGYYIKPHVVKKIKYRDSDKVVENSQAKKKVMSDSTAYMMTDILIDTSKAALGRYSDVNGLTYAAKTGTSNFSSETKQANGLSSDAINDLWCVGYNPSYSIAVWYGYDKIYKNHYTHYGDRNHVKLFQLVAKSVFSSSDGSFKMPDSVSEVTIEYGTNPAKLPSDGTPDSERTVELFKKGTEPTEVSTTYLKLQNVTGLTGTLKDGKLNLSWNKASGLTSTNTSNYGELGYDIYKKENGALTLVKFTTGTTYSTTLDPNTKSVTYVVKTTYSNKKDFASSGTEITISVKEEEPKFSLSSSSTLTTKIGDAVKFPDVYVTKDGKKELIYNGNIKRTLNDGTQVGSSYIFHETGTFSVRYEITYEGKKYNDIIVTVTISEA